jgi:hypothetical protein
MEVALQVNDVPREINIAAFDWNRPKQKFMIDSKTFSA